jgi:uncharacterized protein YdbL (DUF1318 family)
MNFLTRQAWGCLLLGLWLLTACVTVNVYFPAAAAEQAAESIIDDVWGEQTGGPAESPRQTLDSTRTPSRRWSVLDAVAPIAVAAPNLNIDTPAVEKLKRSVSSRNKQLRPFHQKGAVGLTRDGLMAVRDINAVPGNQRNQVKKLVAAENCDRNALYREIARVNGHPEWEPQIRSTFARQWISRAPGGYFVQGPGGWRKK